MSTVDVFGYIGRMHPVTIVMIMIVMVLIVMVRVAVIAVIVWIPIVMVAIIIVPVIRMPGMPPGRVVIPVPGRVPCHIGRQIKKTDQGPGSYFIGCNTVHNNRLPFHHRCCAHITRIGRFTRIITVIGFDDIIFTIQGFIPDQLDPHLVVGFPLHDEYSKVLGFTCIYCNLKQDEMHISIRFINDPDVIDPVIPVQIKIINPGVLIIQVSFKTLKGLRFLEEFHNSKEVQVITWQSQ